MSEDEHLISSMSYQDRLDSANVESFAKNLRGNYRKTSEPTIDYNCLAWAVENDQKWFDPQRFCLGYYWPQGVDREWNMLTILEVLRLYGYSEEADSQDMEAGFIKVAIYADESGDPTHFARQLENGKWTSKAGELIDFEHENLACLECDDYGKVVRIVKKRV